MTSFEEIYSLNSAITNSPYIAALPQYAQNDIKWKWLQLGLGFCTHSLKRNSAVYNLLTQVVEPINTKYTYVGNGSDNQFYITEDITPQVQLYVALKTADSDIYVEIMEGNYTLDIENHLLTLTNIPNNNDSLLIVVYSDGYFANTLDFSLKDIAAEAMTLMYWKQKRNSDTVGDMTLYGSLKGYSQGNHLKVMDEAILELQKTIESHIISYTYG